MARVINLSQLAPEDVAVDYGDGRRLFIPGDTPALTMMRLARLHDDLIENQHALESLAFPGAELPENAGDLGTRQAELVSELDGEILTLLQVRQPDCLATGMSSQQLGWFLGAIIAGFQSLAGDEPPPPPPNRAKKRAARSAPRKTPSKRSSGSAGS